MLKKLKDYSKTQEAARVRAQIGLRLEGAALIPNPAAPQVTVRPMAPKPLAP